MSKQPSNLVASVRDRLRNLADQQNRDFGRVLVAYGHERALHRLSQSRFKNRFVLKGGLLVVLWTQSPGRFTRDADFLDHEPSEEIDIASAFSEILAIDSEDGLYYEVESMRTDSIMTGKVHNCKRVKVFSYLGNARIPILIDVGIGDALHDPLFEIEYPSMLDFPPIKIRSYTSENVVSEKFLAMVEKGPDNSRMKDYYDLFVMSRAVTMEPKNLAKAIQKTFEAQGINPPKARPESLSEDFAQSHEEMWRKYSDDTELAGTKLADVLDDIWSWLGPICHEINEQP